MFKFETYIAPILLSYVDKYVRDFKPVDAQVSLWGGGVTLHNLVLKADVLQQEISLPFNLVSGRIHELLIQVPWTKIMSEPIIVTINTIECILSLNPPPEETAPQEVPSGRSQLVETPPGYMQALVRRIVSNIAVRVNSLIVKYVHDDIVLSLNVKKLSVDCVGGDWQPIFADIDPSDPAIRRLVHLDDLTLCLDKSDSDGKIRFYHEPLLYRCQLDLRVLTRLVSANSRRARSLNIQMLSSRLAWGVNSEQLVLLLRLLNERTPVEVKSPPPLPKQTSVQVVPLHATASTSAEPARGESWTDWAWSWVPSWESGGVGEAPAPPTPIPIAFTAHFDHVSLVFKIMESEGSRKRARGVLELTASDAVIKTYICTPTLLRVNIGARALSLTSQGRCVCGHTDINAMHNEPTIYLTKTDMPDEEPWSWKQEEMCEQLVESAVAADEDDDALSEEENVDTADSSPKTDEDEIDEFWLKMAPVVYFEYDHERTPVSGYENPYDNPPRDFQYSDWVEDCNIKVHLRPITVNVCTGLLHRLRALKKALRDVPAAAEPELPMRTLTVEECDALQENLPVRHIAVKVSGLRVRIIPTSHSTNERPARPPLVLDVQLPTAALILTSPLYPHRVCSAACQLRTDSGTIIQGSRAHITFESTIQVSVSSPSGDASRPCARADVQCATQSLLNRTYFKDQPNTVLYGCTAKIQEANVCGSAARLQAAYHVVSSLVDERMAPALRNTTLAKDALHDQESVAVDITMEELFMRTSMTRNINVLFITINSLKATALHSLAEGELKQAWVFSGPEAPTAVPYFEGGFQWCNEPLAQDSLEYVSLIIKPTAVSLDPMLVGWLGYKYKKTSVIESLPDVCAVKPVTSSQYLHRRRVTPPSSSGRGASRSGSGAELVHVRPRSFESSSEMSDKKENVIPLDKGVEILTCWSSATLLHLYNRLNRLLLVTEVGLIQIYVSPTVASAVDCVNVRDAMEKHALSGQKVFVLSLGRFVMESNVQIEHLWHGVQFERPTQRRPRQDPNSSEESFPWRARITDMSCYTLEARRERRDRPGLRSQLKASRSAVPRSILEPVTTTITLTLVTKTPDEMRPRRARPRPRPGPAPGSSRDDDKTAYFKMGGNFKPSTLKEFVRGPTSRPKTPGPDPPEPSSPDDALTPNFPRREGAPRRRRPALVLGVNLHADTPPVVVKVKQDQVSTVAIALHSFAHVLTLLRSPPSKPKQRLAAIGSSHKPITRSVSEQDARQSASEATTSENRSDPLISIYEANKVEDDRMEIIFWVQWVLSRATLVLATPQMKLAFELEDSIATVDLQGHYMQFKLKVASASARRYRRTSSHEWSPGALNGRILVMREPYDVRDEGPFFTLTVTQALISDLPYGWKDELHSKVGELDSDQQTMWEIYVNFAPLEAVVQPDTLETLMTWINDFTSQPVCPLIAPPKPTVPYQWPLYFLTTGHIKILLTTGEEVESNKDDTLVIVVRKVSITPHPENPICRQSINPDTDSSWTPLLPGLDSLQYELIFRQLAVRAARFSQLVDQEEVEAESLQGTSSENPALKWSQPVVSPIITPILHPVDISGIFAPAVYNCGTLVSGPAIEMNIVTDCSVEMAVDLIDLTHTLTQRTLHVLTDRSEFTFLQESDRNCIYAFTQDTAEPAPVESETALPKESDSQEAPKSAVDLNRSFVFDSGVETTTSNSTSNKRRDSTAMKKSVSIACMDTSVKPSDYIEVYVTMGHIDLSLYARDDNSPEIQELRPPPGVYKVDSEPQIKIVVDESKDKPVEEKDSTAGNRSVSENNREADIGKTKLEEIHVLPLARKSAGNVPLIHVTLQQPNIYYVTRNKKKNLQVTLINAWAGLGAGRGEGEWSAPLLSSARGTPDPITDITPSLMTLRYDVATAAFPTLSNSSGRVNVQVDVDRPIMFDVSTDRIRRIKAIIALLKRDVTIANTDVELREEEPGPFLYKLKQKLAARHLESVIVQIGQIGLRGSEGVVGADGIRVQLATGGRPERLTCRALVSAAVVTAGPGTDRRHVILQPLMAGMVAHATWDAWKRAEDGSTIKEPSLRVGIDLDRLVLDVRPKDLAAAVRLRDTAEDVLGLTEMFMTASSSQSEVEQPAPSASTDTNDQTNQFYKDDLRSGAFKIVAGCQPPMAYQVTLHGSTVSWRYPHPRTITRIVVYPMPNLEDDQVECVLELYCPMMTRWEPHTYFKLPVTEPKDMVLATSTTDAVFALMWRVRVCSESEEIEPFIFNPKKFMPRLDPLSPEPASLQPLMQASRQVSAEQLSGTLRVDSFLAPTRLPRARLALRLATLELNAHNNVSAIHRRTPTLEGYYVTRPLMSSHRVLTLRARNTSAHFIASTSSRLLLDTHLSSDIIDGATGTMESLVEEFRLQGAVSLCKAPRLRLRAGDIRISLLVARVSTLRSLVDDWNSAYKHHVQMICDDTTSEELTESTGTERDTTLSLQGRVSLWVHNDCSVAMRIGQEGTDELVPITAGASLAYRWRTPKAPKELRFSIVTPSMNWHWSRSVPFSVGTYRVQLEDTEETRSTGVGGACLYVRVTDTGSRRDMHLSGRLVLANMLRQNLLYKVRARSAENNVWQTISSGELQAERIGLSVLCNPDCEAVLKIKLASQDTAWSGDIPLKECRKENVPWLVKAVPSQGEISYTSVWCRVIRARSDGRTIATAWPFYVLRSNLPLDVDVRVTSERGSAEDEPVQPSTTVHTAAGRGGTTHLALPGTTSARHMLTFKYRNIESQVTREAVPLHYGMTETSVFDRSMQINNIEDAIEMIQQWLQQSSLDTPSNWPYTTFTKHWPGDWQPTLWQSQSDVHVHYEPIRAGGGCSLELQLSPVSLLANAAPIPILMRGHDGSSLCKLEPGTATSPTPTLLLNPFFIGIEDGHEMFVSDKMRVCREEQGRYGQPGRGQVALEKPVHFAVPCNKDTVALLTMCYEIKEDINILAVTSTYVLINRLPNAILASPIASTTDMENLPLPQKEFRVVYPTREGSIQGTALCQFELNGRWKANGVNEELKPHLRLALPAETIYDNAVPICLETVPARRALALVDEEGKSVPIVVTLVRHEARCLITVAEDPCPQFVVNNCTKTVLAIAQPVEDEFYVGPFKIAEECPGVPWHCVVEPGGITHYSTPGHCERYPPPPNAQEATYIPQITVGLRTDEDKYEWCPPILIADGEQLLQLSGDVTIKLRLRTHPHSTLVEFQDIDENDISASLIRSRLKEESKKTSTQEVKVESADSRRLSAEAKALDQPSTSSVEAKPSLPANIYEPSTSSIQQVETEKTAPGGDLKAVASTSKDDASHLNITRTERDAITQYQNEIFSSMAVARKDSADSYENLYLMDAVSPTDWSDGTEAWGERELVRALISRVVVTVGASSETLPLLAVHLQRVSTVVHTDARKTKTTVSIADVQIDNAQYETEQYDFAVVATTQEEKQPEERWPALWAMSNERLPTRASKANLLLKTCHEKWTVAGRSYQELTDIEVLLGSMGLYVEDAFVAATLDLFHLAFPTTSLSSEAAALAEINTIQTPFRLRKLVLHPLDLSLTLHTAVRMYIALDESPLRLGAFSLEDAMTSFERLSHALTVHYLSAAVLGAGWVVGGLELLGAPGALASRVGSAGGGVRGVASAAAGALLRSLSSAAGSLARNLDLLAGDDEHARRAAAARRHPPPNLMAGLVAGITNFAINMLGAVGGIAHHPLVGVAVGESESGAAALRRGILGAITKPLSATADLVAFAGHGLLSQTGWDPVPQPKASTIRPSDTFVRSGWSRDCVRWGFRFAELGVLAGFEATLGDARLQLLVTHKYLIMMDLESERITEMIDLKICSLGVCQNHFIELFIKQKRPSRATESRAVVNEEEREVQLSVAAMARVARYTGAEVQADERLLLLRPAADVAHAAHAALAAALHSATDDHFNMM